MQSNTGHAPVRARRCGDARAHWEHCTTGLSHLKRTALCLLYVINYGMSLRGFLCTCAMLNGKNQNEKENGNITVRESPERKGNTAN